MNILLLGSGGREHAFAWKLAQSKHCSKLIIAPGNGGTAQFGANVNIKTTDFDEIKRIVIKNQIGMVVAGPEDPLVNGITDFFLNDPQINKIPVIGPSKQGAALEGSKDFAKQFMVKYGVPTAAYATFTRQTLSEGIEFLRFLKPPYVLKADGLAAGKGVLILDSFDEAQKELEQMLSGKFGSASQQVVIEEFLPGIELSVFALTDGENYKILPAAKDYKRIGDGDTGLNTGGMGAVSPVPFADNLFLKKVEERIISPTVKGLKEEKILYKGFLFFGLMNVNGDPYVIEYNCRMGDPETEAVLPRIKSDLVELFQAVAGGTLNECKLVIDNRFAVTVILASKGYPGSYSTGFEISGIDQATDCLVFQAGTRSSNNQCITSGGRVLAVTAFGNELEQAIRLAYKGVEPISFEGKYFRSDIGKDLLKFTIRQA
ncbi:MAG: phosphoribosylamine--glycine ligase [Bacteroidia bacterium]|nr:phosphoribosylamine--glycine ligase [Bacteroidia bacterium]MCZ2276668.1 phosphoribosylamine--glycine ligase [Bacteroidia bacterium]